MTRDADIAQRTGLTVDAAVDASAQLDVKHMAKSGVKDVAKGEESVSADDRIGAEKETAHTDGSGGSRQRGQLEDAPADYAPRSVWATDCTACGACCAAPDIAALNKPLGLPCHFLAANCLCSAYDTRPEPCRAYTPDWVCGEVAPLPTLEGRTHRFLEIYGLLEEAESVVWN